MSVWDDRSYALNLCAGAVCAVAVGLAGCGGGSVTQTSPLPARDIASPAHVSPAYGVIYNFQGYPKDGRQPYSSLTYSKGTLYGTTAMGGKTDNGTIFEISQGSQQETKLYSFDGAGDGADPRAGVSIVNGVVYGTTTGSTSTHGTVYTLASAGPSTIYKFKGGADGAVPTAQLDYVPSAAAFYSTTASGGTYGQGTVFSVTSSGHKQIVYSFKGYSGGDGATPISGVKNDGGILYGTTEYGGQYNKGTLYSVSLSGQESIIHSFGSSAYDGEYPQSGVTSGPAGTLYGTTDNGGTKNKGTVYKFSSHSGEFDIIYSFGGNPDGAFPLGGLTFEKGVLYGTTSGGGKHSKGTVYAIAAGKESVLHYFPAFSGDGTSPARRLSYENGVLYGTTRGGGTGSCPGTGGCGTVFEITP